MDILARDGLSAEILASLSYRSELGISLKKDLRYFPSLNCSRSSIRYENGMTRGLRISLRCR